MNLKRNTIPYYNLLGKKTKKLHKTKKLQQVGTLIFKDVTLFGIE